MNDLVLKLLTLAYASVGVIGAIGYWPTMRDLWRKKPSANTTSYIVWSFTTGSAFFYGLFILPDPFFRLVSGMNFFACSTILVLSIRLRFYTSPISQKL